MPSPTQKHCKLYIKDASGEIIQMLPRTTIPEYQGATSSADGTAGLVPAATSAQKDNFLKGDGTWAQVAWSDVTSKPSSFTPTAHASSATTYGVSSASNYGHAKASSTTPKAPGATASLGTETTTFARGDHVHPMQNAVTAVSASFECKEKPVLLPLCFCANLCEYWDDSETDGCYTYQNAYNTIDFSFTSGVESKIATLQVVPEFSAASYVLTFHIGDVCNLSECAHDYERSQSSTEHLYHCFCYNMECGSQSIQVGESRDIVFTTLSSYDANPGFPYRTTTTTHISSTSVTINSELFGQYTVSARIVREPDGPNGEYVISIYATAVSAKSGSGATPVLSLTSTEANGTSSSLEVDMSSIVSIIPESPSNYQGATSSANGVAGLVPAATSAQKDNFLKGDGTWATVSTEKDVAVRTSEPTAANTTTLANESIIFYNTGSAQNAPQPVFTSGNQTIGGVKTFSAGIFSGKQAMSGTAMDCAAASCFTKTVTGTTTFSFTNVPSDAVCCVTLVLINGGNYTVNWPSSVKWTGNLPPELTSNGTDVLTFLTCTGGNVWYGTTTCIGVTA